MRENNRKPIEKCRKKLPQFTTMNVIDGQAGLVIYSSLIFYSLTIDNILNIIVLLILAGVSIAALTGSNGLLTRANQAKEETQMAGEEELRKLTQMEAATNLENKEYIDNNRDKAMIPAGFAVSQVEGENVIDDGLVIIDSEGNEFVWIPIERTTLNVKGTTKPMARVTSGFDNNGNTNYQGVLYDFSYDGEQIISVEKLNYGQGTTSYREPAYLEKPYWGDSSDYNTAGITSTQLQEEYNDMIKSVKTFGGFYIARYELAINNDKPISKQGVMPTTSENSVTYTWYGLYSMAKKYNNTNNAVKSTMIWGSQYDAMQNFALEGEDKSKVIETTNAKHNLENNIYTGSTPSDKILNIFDLEGNVMEWTMESDTDMKRVRRGGVFNNINISPSTRTSCGVSDHRDYEGTRMSLYIVY